MTAATKTDRILLAIAVALSVALAFGNRLSATSPT